ncbi:DUF4125 family protein [Lacrimispora sp.]|uniref:DUF4125 family protein n=1 Tax=Lacrimispora sp. TaxID=2719234 RepID=UPI002FD9F6AB
MNDRLTEQIIDFEWNMFSSVNNAGGPAPCQSDKETFVIMRSSQFKTWNEETLENYLEDLKTAAKENWNLVTEKYARMMKYTFPQEYDSIKDALPEASAAKEELVSKIVEYHKIWNRELEEQYPNVMKHGRPVLTQEDDENHTSIETYLTGELLTYSEKTLRSYFLYAAFQMAGGINMSRKTLEYTARAYGYENLEKAEKNISNKDNDISNVSK